MVIVLAGCGGGLAVERSEQDPLEALDSPTTTALRATSAPTTATPIVLPSISAGEMHIEPGGPYIDGQQVTLYADDDASIDLYNSWPRVCAVVGKEPEVCGAEPLKPKPVRTPPAGTQAVTVDLTRSNFDSSGPLDCGAAGVACRLLWRNEAGEFLTSAILTFTGELAEPLVRVSAELTNEPGVVRIDTNNMDLDESLNRLPPEDLARIEATISEYGSFDRERLEIDWSVGSMCGYGSAGAPIGSEDLIDQPSWWNVGDENENEGDPLHFFGPVCDGDAVEGSLDGIGSDGILEVRLQRNIYGYGGWIDCATSSCFVTIKMSWLHPEPGGGELGDEGDSIRVAIDVPASWPSQRPTLSIAEPPPYRSGQTVTVEATGLTGDDTAIGWCPGGDGYCGWKFADVVNGAATVQWTIPGSAENCGLQRCYFAVDSASEGLAPPAIVLVPLVDR